MKQNAAWISQKENYGEWQKSNALKFLGIDFGNNLKCCRIE